MIFFFCLINSIRVPWILLACNLCKYCLTLLSFLSAIFLQKRPSTSFRNLFLPYWGKLVYRNFHQMLKNDHIQISMNAATAAMIATIMQLVQIWLDTSTVDVYQDSQEMAVNVVMCINLLVFPQSSIDPNINILKSFIVFYLSLYRN